MKIEIRDDILEKFKIALDMGVERGLFSRIPIEDEINAFLEDEADRLIKEFK